MPSTLSKSVKIFGSLILSLSTFILTVSAAYAVGVKPLRTELMIEPGASETAVLQIINSENQTIQVRPVIEVYTENDEAGFPVPTDLPMDDPRNPTSWITFEEKVIELAPNASKDIRFTVTIPADTEPGGRYASVIYEPVVTAGEVVHVRARVASLLLITVAGTEIRAGTLESFSLQDNRILGDQPVAFAIQVANSGNVHLKPSGWIKLTEKITGTQLKSIARYVDPKTGKEVVADKMPVNIINQGSVLPGSKRTFGGNWNENIQSGKYIATVEIFYADGAPALIGSLDLTIRESLTAENLVFEQTESGSQFVVTFKNNGVVYERPQGTITIVNEFEHTVAELTIPEDVEYIAPDETKIIVLPWLKKDVPTGKYTARLSVAFGHTGESTSVETSFTSGGASFVAWLQTLPGWSVLLGAVALIIVAMIFLSGRRRKIINAD